MESIIPKFSSSLSKMWNKIINQELSLFPALKEELRLEELSDKESKLIKILDKCGQYSVKFKMNK